MSPARPAGFSLVELLVVIAVVAILAGLAFGPLAKAREAGRATACLSNLRQIGFALQLYTQENNNRMPVMRDRLVPTQGTNAGEPWPAIEMILAPYVTSPVFRCPSDRQQLYEKTGSSYSWNVLVNGYDADQLKLMNTRFHHHQIPLVYDKEPFHLKRGPGKGMNFLFADGHIKNLLTLEQGW